MLTAAAGPPLAGPDGVRLLGWNAQIGVLQWFARLWEIDQDEFWGYITNCGTEGNLHGILVGRENLPDGLLYSSEESHYSVFKAARMYRMDSVKVHHNSVLAFTLRASMPYTVQACSTQGAWSHLVSAGQDAGDGGDGLRALQGAAGGERAPAGDCERERGHDREGRGRRPGQGH